MAGSKTNYWEDKVIRLAAGLTTLTPALTPYLALIIGPAAHPDDTDVDMSTLDEPTYAGYARVALTGNLTVSGTNPTKMTNTAAVVFPDVTGADTDTIIGWAICDGVGAAANVLYYGAVTPNKTVDVSNTPPTLAANELDVEEA